MQEPITIFDGKRIILGVTGSIACYKAVDLASKLTQAGAQVDVIMTDHDADWYLTTADGIHSDSRWYRLGNVKKEVYDKLGIQDFDSNHRVVNYPTSRHDGRVGGNFGGPCSQWDPVFDVAGQTQAQPDGHVDTFDFTQFQACATGPDLLLPGNASQMCQCMDIDGDDDIDLDDFQVFQLCYTGSVLTVNASCDD